MPKRNVVQEAVEEVKEMKRVAIANAKSVLAESFTNDLQAAVSKAVNESLATGNDQPAGYDEDGEQKKVGENLPADGESGDDLSDEGDGPAVIESSIEEGDDFGDDEYDEDMDEMVEMEDDEEEVDIDIDLDDDGGEEEVVDVLDEPEEEIEEAEEAPVQENAKLRKENRRLRGRVAKLEEAIGLMRDNIQETTLFNARLAYATKTFNNGSFSKQQKARIIKRFDECESVGEVKRTYKALTESIRLARPAKRRVKANKVVHSVKSQLDESAENGQFNRWQKLANLND